MRRDAKAEEAKSSESALHILEQAELAYGEAKLLAMRADANLTRANKKLAEAEEYLRLGI